MRRSKAGPGAGILDVGCRTGAASLWLAEHDYRVTGVEEYPRCSKSPRHASARGPRADQRADWIECDLRALHTIPGPADLILALDGVLNRAASLRELEAMLRGMYALLDDQKG